MSKNLTAVEIDMTFVPMWVKNTAWILTKSQANDISVCTATAFCAAYSFFKTLIQNSA